MPAKVKINTDVGPYSIECDMSVMYVQIIFLTFVIYLIIILQAAGEDPQVGSDEMIDEINERTPITFGGEIKMFRSILGFLGT